MDSSRQELDTVREAVLRGVNEEHSEKRELNEDSSGMQSMIMAAHFSPSSLMVAPPVEMMDKLPLSFRVAQCMLPLLLVVTLVIQVA